jgi:hypothetical protein
MVSPVEIFENPCVKPASRSRFFGASVGLSGRASLILLRLFSFEFVLSFRSISNIAVYFGIGIICGSVERTEDMFWTWDLANIFLQAPQILILDIHV